MSHTAGLSGWTEPLEPEDLADWDRCTSLLAAQEPWWEPGTASGYHAVTQGYLIGEVVRRITGVSIGTWFATEVAAPLGADFYIGLPESEDHRVSVVIPPPPIDLEALNPSDIACGRSPTRPSTPPIPARTGGAGPRSPPPTGTATPGRWPPSSRSSPGAARPAGSGCCPRGAATPSSTSSPTARTSCSACPTGSAWATGWPPSSMPIGPRACYWGGYGGSLVVMDQDAGLTVGYMMNRMESGLRATSGARTIVLAAAAALGRA